MSDVGVVCEQDGVVGHHWITGRQNASGHMAHTVQDAVIHQEVVHQQLHTQRETPLISALERLNVKRRD